MKQTSLKTSVLSLTCLSSLLLGGCTSGNNAYDFYINVNPNTIPKGVNSVKFKVTDLVPPYGTVQLMLRELSLPIKESFRPVGFESALQDPDVNIIVTAEKDNILLAYEKRLETPIKNIRWNDLSDDHPIPDPLFNTFVFNLRRISKKLTLALNPLPPRPSKTLLELKSLSMDQPIYMDQQLSDQTISLDEVPNGAATIKLVVFDADSHPVMRAEKALLIGQNDTIDHILSSENQTLDLETVSLPDSIDLATYNTVPTALIQNLQNNLIAFPDNHPPVLNETEIKVKVNGVEKSFQDAQKQAICVKPGDQYQIEVNASDPDQDSLAYYWVQTSSNAQTFKLSRMSAQGNTVSGNIDFIYSDTLDPNLNRGAIGLVISDKKSYIGPFSVYFDTNCQ